jgi:hypothetical protein
MTTNLLRVRFEQPYIWRSFAPYWEVLPDSSGVLSKYNFPQEHMPVLQDKDIVSASPSVTMILC